MANRRVVSPRGTLSEQWVAELRDAVAQRDDIAAVYLLTALYETPEGVVAQDEIHIELVEPPEYAAGPEQFRTYSFVIPGNGPVWTVTPARLLPSIRDVGRRVV